MAKVNFEKQREIIEYGIKNEEHSREYFDGYINALYDYNLINDNQFTELYNLIWEITKIP